MFTESKDFSSSAETGNAEIFRSTKCYQSKTVELIAEARLPTKSGSFRIIGFRSHVSIEEFVVLVRRRLQADKPTLVKIHSQRLTGIFSVRLNITAGNSFRQR